MHMTLFSAIASLTFFISLQEIKILRKSLLKFPGKYVCVSFSEFTFLLLQGMANKVSFCALSRIRQYLKRTKCVSKISACWLLKLNTLGKKFSERFLKASETKFLFVIFNFSKFLETYSMNSKNCVFSIFPFFSFVNFPKTLFTIASKNKLKFLSLILPKNSLASIL